MHDKIPALLVLFAALFAPGAQGVPGIPALPAKGAGPGDSLRIKAVGDVMLARSVGRKLAQNGWQAIFGPDERVLAEADILTANLECCISTRGKPENKKYTFRADPGAAAALSRAGFTLVSLANNHAMDYGPKALAETISLLDAAGIAHVGAGANEDEARKPAIVARGRLRVAFLGYVAVPVESGGFDIRSWQASAKKPGVALAIPGDIRSDVSAALGQADAVVVLLHAGQEGSTARTRAQTDAARAAIDGGASLVVGSHPHVVQDLETYGKGYIAFSLGNWIFDGFEEAGESGAVLDAVLTVKSRPENVATAERKMAGADTAPAGIAGIVSASLLRLPRK